MMQSSDSWGDNSMPWDTPDNDVQAMPWRAPDNGLQDSHMNAMLDFMGTMDRGSQSMWQTQPAQGSYAHNPIAAGQWQTAHNHATFGQMQPGFHTLRDMQGGYNGQERARANQIQEFRPAGYNGQERVRATQSQAIKPARPPPSFAALRKLQGDDGSDDSETETSAGSTFLARTDSSEDDVNVKQAARKTDSSLLSKADMVGMEATQAERDEAESVVRTAFQDMKVRDRMRSKVSTASPNDLQAMLNARLKR